jgi:crystallin alpha B
VKTVEEYLIIEGNHEEKQDEHGFITRSFKRRFQLPSEVNKEDLQLECEIGVDGVLKVTVPKKVFAGSDGNAKIHSIKKITA